MSIHRIRLHEIQPNNQSFSHQQSVNQIFDPKHKKKSSLHQKPIRKSNYQRLKTDERQSPAIFKNQALNACGNSMQLAQSTFSASKLGKSQQKVTLADPKKAKKQKQTISIINLSKNLSDSKAKMSSTVTKRKQSAVDFGQKLKEKTQDFKVLSTCVEEYVNEERRNNNEVNLGEIIKIICAFNRSEIAPISKPLEKLIDEIVSSIQYSLPIPQPQPQPQIKSILKKSSSFDSPQYRIASEEPNTIKKKIVARQFEKEPQENQGENRLDENLNILKYQSNRFKYFFDQILAKNKESKKEKDLAFPTELEEQQKLKELRQLKKIAEQQARIIEELQYNSQHSSTFRSESPIE